jgi:isopenicillin N synthase-like dioxygenase
MQQVLNYFFGANEETQESSSHDPWKNLPPKNANWQIPESIFDNVPIHSDHTLPFDFVKLEISSLLNISKLIQTNQTSPQIDEYAKLIIGGLQKNRFLSLMMSEEDKEAYEEYTTTWHKFFSNSLKEKENYKTQHPPKSDIKDDPLTLRTGYEQIHFDNRGNCRDEEFRDIFILYGSELLRDDIRWPNENLKKLSIRFATLFWEVSVAIILLIERGLQYPTWSLVNLLLKKDCQNSPQISNSFMTNFSVFRYHDAVQEKQIKKPYTVPQKCMVHRDQGFLTLLPKSTYSGIQALCPFPVSNPDENPNRFVELENFIEKGQILAYTGRILEIVTKGALRPLVHRVVRYPEHERVSSPFEAHSDLDTQIEVGNLEGLPDVVTVRKIKEAMAWDSLQRKVLRTDGIPPEQHSQHLNGELVPLLTLYGDTLVVNE